MSETAISLKRLAQALLVAVILYAPACFAKYSGGSGALSSPYRIATPNDLNDIANHPEDFKRYFVMTNDINLTIYGPQFKVIGNVYTPFTGVFDGNNHRISNFACVGTSQAGFFGNIAGQSAQIKNVILMNPTVTAASGRDVGSLVGLMSGGKIINCQVVGGTVVGGQQVGGLIGTVAEGTVTKCKAKVIIEGKQSVGGLVGINAGTIIDCLADCNVTGTDYFVGGLAGDSASNGIFTSCSTGKVVGGDYAGGLVGYFGATDIRDCYSTGSVSGGQYVGGLVGYFDTGLASHCYSAASVTGTTNVGGLVGFISTGTARSSFWDVNVSGQNTSAGGTGKTTAAMKKQSTFIAVNWDFVAETAKGRKDIWTMCEGGSYPSFAWQGLYVNPDANEPVDFVNFAKMGRKWKQSDTSRCAGGSELTGDGKVDLNDLGVLADYWLKRAGCIDNPGNPPTSSIILPRPNAVLGGEVALSAGTTDNNGAAGVYFCIREPNNGKGVPVGNENIPADFNDTSGKWECNVDSNNLADGGYVVVAKVVNECGSADYSLPVRLTIANNVLATKCAVAAGAKPTTDSVSISGIVIASAGDFSSAKVVEVNIYSQYMEPCIITFPINEKTFKNGRYSFSGTENGVKKSFRYDTKKCTFTFTAGKVDLSGLSCPMTAEIKIGENVNKTVLDEVIVNGKAPIPIILMMGIKDTLRVDKFQVKRSKKANASQLLVKGGFALGADVNMAETDFTITLPGQQFTILAGKFKPGRDKYFCSNIKLMDGASVIGIASADFNLKTCVFTVTIRNTDITAVQGTADLKIEFGTFSEGATVDLP